MKRSGENVFKKIFFSQKFIALAGLAVVVLIGLPLAKNAAKQYRINKEISGLKKEINGLENKNVDLQNFVSYLRSDQFAEEQARLNLNLKKTGEELTVIKFSADSPARSSLTDGNPIFNIPGYNRGKNKPDDPNPKKWIDYFFSAGF